MPSHENPLALSNASWAQTGYGLQTDQVTKQLRDAGHEVAISAFWGLGGRKLEWEGMPVYPADEEWGNTWLTMNAHDWGEGDLTRTQVITLMDVWVLTAPILNTLNIASWVPVDHDPLPPRVFDFFRRTGAAPIAMSKWGAKKLGQAGLQPLYVPHGIDTEVLKPIPQKDARQATGAVPEDAFVVGMVAANKGNAPPRKAFPMVFEAFAQFQRKHKDAILYLHSMKRPGPSGLDLVALARIMGIPDSAIRFTPEYSLHIGVEAWKMPYVISQFDVLCNPSYGEGFGIPILEAQACGVPVIVSDFSAMPELVGHGWTVEGHRWFDQSQGSWLQAPEPDAILAALEVAYEERGGNSVKAREFALQYDAKTVFEKQWKPILAELERRMEARREMPPVTLNRAARRRKAREHAA